MALWLGSMHVNRSLTRTVQQTYLKLVQYLHRQFYWTRTTRYYGLTTQDVKWIAYCGWLFGANVAQNYYFHYYSLLFLVKHTILTLFSFHCFCVWLCCCCCVGRNVTIVWIRSVCLFMPHLRLLSFFAPSISISSNSVLFHFSRYIGHFVVVALCYRNMIICLLVIGIRDFLRAFFFCCLLVSCAMVFLVCCFSVSWIFLQ